MTVAVEDRHSAQAELDVLVVLPDLPLPEGGAPGRCSVALLRGLREHGARVTAIAARQQFSPAGDMPPDLDVTVVDVAPLPRWRSRAGRLVRPAGELCGGGFGALVRERARAADVVYLDAIQTAWCDHRMVRPSVLHLHYRARRDRPLGPPWRRQFFQVAEQAIAETIAARRHEYLVANSPVVAAELQGLAPDAVVARVPLCLDPQYYPAASLDGPPRAGIIGTADWPPTASAIQRLLTRVWPLVRRRVPEARLVVAGRGVSEAVRDAVPGVDVVGPVASASDFLRDLSLLLYPVARGSGMKVKVLEAIASGVPVVTTQAGAEGIQADGGVVVDEDDVRLAAAAASILRNESERRERGATARAAFSRRYAPGPATEPLLDLLSRAANAGPHRASSRP